MDLSSLSILIRLDGDIDPDFIEDGNGHRALRGGQDDRIRIWIKSHVLLEHH